MKRVSNLTKIPAKAALWQEILCRINQVLVVLLGAFGGSSPLLNFIANICDLPE